MSVHNVPTRHLGKTVTHLELRMTLLQQHIYRLHTIDVSVFLMLFSDLRSDARNGHVKGVHLLDFGTLFIDCLSGAQFVMVRGSARVQLVAIPGSLSALVVAHLPN
jgi:hypothetical protein